MNNDNIKAVIFDLGNVWVDFNHMIAAQRIARFTNKIPKEIFDLFFDSELTSQFEEGRIAANDFFLSVQKKLNLRISYQEFIPIWNEIFFLSNKNIEVHNLAKQLKQNYTLVLLSNINVLHFEYLKAQFPVFSIFNNIILSYQLHLRKPDRKIYRATLEILNLKAPEVAYTDDRPEFIERANLLGIKSLHFQTPDKLKEDFINARIHLD